MTITGDANGDDVTLAGGITDVAASGAARLDDNSRIFDATVDLTLDGLTLTGGRTTAENESGGAVRGRAVTLTNSTVSGNSTIGASSEGGGVHINYTYSGYYGVYGGVTLTNSLVLGNATIFAGVDADEVEGPVTRSGGNILGPDIFDGDADVGDVTAEEVFAATAEIAPGVLAGALADNGGPTRTIAIRAEGPAAGAADPEDSEPVDPSLAPPPEL